MRPQRAVGLHRPDGAAHGTETAGKSLGVGHGGSLAIAVPVVFLVLPVTVLFALFPGLISIVSLAR
ncbi:hypothetical protein FHU33_3891 [Blastococcus colisei]|uniref:Uncharacterized protein n=1 Tax=Blastococcus colisei TaxID=1564162 RepID=A0A543PJZ4_9ACTN|nr:hypothetical protein FHU33_3891 [Blastococcus colisei]